MVAGADLSPYERDLIPVDEYVAFVRDEHRRRAREAEAAALKQKRLATIQKLRPAGIVFRTPHLAQLNAHAIALCEAHDVAVELQYDGGGAAHYGTRSVSVPPVTNEDSYAVVLHELGHLLSIEADSRQHRHVISTREGMPSGGGMVAPLGEAGAWRWAVAHAKTWTRAMHDHLANSLGHNYVASYAVNDTERALLADVVRESAFKIADKPITFAQLDAVCRSIEGPLSHAAHVQTAPAETIVPRTDGNIDLKVMYDGQRTVTLCSKDGTPIEGGVMVFPVTIYRGVYEAGRAYEKGDSVTFRGSTWTARDATSATPGIGATPWQLSTKAGRDGKDR